MCALRSAFVGLEPSSKPLFLDKGGSVNLPVEGKNLKIPSILLGVLTPVELNVEAGVSECTSGACCCGIRDALRVALL